MSLINRQISRDKLELTSVCNAITMSYFDGIIDSTENSFVALELTDLLYMFMCGVKHIKFTIPFIIQYVFMATIEAILIASTNDTDDEDAYKYIVEEIVVCVTSFKYSSVDDNKIDLYVSGLESRDLDAVIYPMVSSILRLVQKHSVDNIVFPFHWKINISNDLTNVNQCILIVGL